MGVDNLRDRAFLMCKQFLGGAWETISCDEILFNQISGGLSNELFSCALPEECHSLKGEPTQVLVRFYGEGCCDLNELKTFKMLSMKSISPRLYGDFEDGRIEEFLPSSNLTYKDLKDTQISAIIAKRLATIHTLDIPIIGQSNKESFIAQKCFQFLQTFAEQTSSPKGIKYILNNSDLKPSTRRLAKQLLGIDFKQEIEFIQTVSLRSKSPIVFSHNDIHRGNLLLTEICENRTNLSDRIVFIDFEYSGYNHRAYDITNYFIEHCFEYNEHTYPYFEYNENKYPSESERLFFAKNYLIQYEKSLKNKQKIKKAAGIKTSQKPNNSNSSVGVDNQQQNNNRRRRNSICNNINVNNNSSSIHHHHQTNNLSKMTTTTTTMSLAPTTVSILNQAIELEIDDEECVEMVNIDKHCQLTSGNIINGTVVVNNDSGNGGDSRRSSIVLSETESDLLDEVESLIIAPHFFWMLWSMKMALTSQIKFGYWEYAMLRYKLYLKYKQQLIERLTTEN